MDVLNVLEVLLVLNGCLHWVRNEESIMGITSRVSLRLEEGVKVPEGTLHISIGLHLLESHLKEDLNKLLPCLHQMV